MTWANENRPVWQQGGSPEVIDGTLSIDPDTDMRQRITGCFVAVVQIKSDTVEPRYSRRVFLSLAPAQKAAQRARGRGLQAAVYVAELAPVGVV